MAYLARIDRQQDQQQAFVPTLKAVGPSVTSVEFTPLEWSVVRLARLDDLSSLREPGPVRRFYSWLIGRHESRELANPRLEALRRMAVLSWHFGFSVPGEDVSAFLEADYSIEQYELLVTSVRAVVASESRRIH